jgi:hypothetical protein
MPSYLELKVKELDLEPVEATLSPAPTWVSLYKYSVGPFDQYYGTYDITVYLSINPPSGTPDGTYSVGLTLSDTSGKVTTHSINIILNSTGTLSFDPNSVSGLWGWWQPGNWVTQSGNQYNDITLWYDSSPGGHHLNLDRRMTNLPWDSNYAGNAYTLSFIKKLSDNSLLFSWSHNNNSFENMTYVSAFDMRKVENALITKNTSFYSNQYSVFFVYRNHLGFFSHVVTGMSSYIDYFETWSLNIWDSNISRSVNEKAIIVHSPVVINRSAPYTTLSMGSSYNDDNNHNFRGGWFMALCVPPYAISPSNRDPYYHDDKASFTTMSVFTYADKYYTFNVPHQPYITIFKINENTESAFRGVNPIVLPYYTNDEYASMSKIEKNNNFTRFVVNKDQWNVVGYIVEENPLISASTVIGYSYTYSIYFNETQSTIKYATASFYNILRQLLPPTTYAYINGSDNQSAYVSIYGGFGIGTRFAAAQTYFYSARGSSGWTSNAWVPGVFSLSFRECLFYTRALWTEAPQIMEYLMRKHGVPVVS